MKWIYMRNGHKHYFRSEHPIGGVPKYMSIIYRSQLPEDVRDSILAGMRRAHNNAGLDQEPAVDFDNPEPFDQSVIDAWPG